MDLNKMTNHRDAWTKGNCCEKFILPQPTISLLSVWDGPLMR